MSAPQISWLPDGRRLHMNHGPIDLIVEAFGDAAEVRAAYGQAAARFETILAELVAELPMLRSAACTTPRGFRSRVAQRMEDAASRLVADAHGYGKSLFLTPIAAVAGAVAHEMLAALVSGRDLEKAYVNNGGDIAIHLSPDADMKAAIAGTAHGLEDRLTVRFADPVRGMATSGWRGRSFSLGIADAVTVLARTAAEADSAATVIANAVDLPNHPAITRLPACELAPDSDLGERLVTAAVGHLSREERAAALDAGLATADELRRSGLIDAAALFLGDDARVSGMPAESLVSPADMRSVAA